MASVSAAGGCPLLQLIGSQSQNVTDELYTSPSVSSAVYRSVSPLAQQILSRLTFVDSPINSDMLLSWTSDRFQPEMTAAIDSLIKLDVLKPGHSNNLAMNSAFQTSFRQALIGGRAVSCGLREAKVEKIALKLRKSAAELTAYAVERWEALLIYLALPAAADGQKVSVDMRAVLNFAGFVNESASSLAEPDITSDGFHFLLMDTCSQLWSYLQQYIRYRSRNGSTVDVIRFLCQLSFTVPNQTYSVENLSASVMDFVQHLREMGLIWMRKRKDGWFYVTSMIGHLCWSQMPTALTDNTGASTTNDQFLVIETNYRVYAYTDSQLQLAILSTFCEMIYRFANMSVGVLTRESVRRSLQLGISAVQIIEYLRTHSRPSTSAHAVPPTISDQLRLWELERDRLKFDSAVLYSNFDTERDFSMLRAYAADDVNCVLWENVDRMEFVVTAQGHEQVKEYWKQHRQRN